MSDNMPKCYTDEWRTANKVHKCCECRGTIFYKERYNNFKGVWDSPDEYKTCEDCMDLRHIISKDLYYDDRPVFGELGMYMFDSGYEYAPYMMRMIDIMDKRGAPVRASLRKQVKEFYKKYKKSL